MSSSVTVSSAASSAWIPCNTKSDFFQLSIAAVVSGTLTYTVEHTFDNIQDPTVTPTAFPLSSMAAKTASAEGSYNKPIRAVRITVTSWTSGSVTLTVTQNTNSPDAVVASADYKVVVVPNFLPTVISSFSASTTASCTSNVVTVTAPSGHGLPVSTKYVGYKFFYPGSPTLAAGFYPALLSVVDSNTLTFSASSVDFGSESVNGGVTYNTATEFASYFIPGGTLRSGSRLLIRFYYEGNSIAGAKYVQAFLDGVQVAQVTVTSHVNSSSGLGFVCDSSVTQLGTATSEFSATGSSYAAARTLTSDLVLSIRSSGTGPACYVAYTNLYLEFKI